MHPIHDTVLRSSAEDWVLKTPLKAQYAALELTFMLVKNTMMCQVAQYEDTTQTLNQVFAVIKIPPTIAVPKTFEHGFRILQTVMDLATTERFHLEMQRFLLDGGYHGSYHVYAHDPFEIFANGAPVECPPDLQQRWQRAGPLLVAGPDLRCEQGIFRGKLPASSHARLQLRKNVEQLLEDRF